jgi:hypothetical protein
MDHIERLIGRGRSGWLATTGATGWTVRGGGRAQRPDLVDLAPQHRHLVTLDEDLLMLVGIDAEPRRQKLGELPEYCRSQPNPCFRAIPPLCVRNHSLYGDRYYTEQ